ncbi:Pre-mRNA-splicing factor cef1 [Apophysomyces ossiformis]|uniref:Pre-mRNA-splicing factor cef1 n=2 Tax=Mucoromycota TaxID=1913637 RepID=A0A8H7ERU3_9FUNG|nr:Pre-mRNA-splicing factor cef1 [Apophysomyces ossiformis]
MRTLVKGGIWKNTEDEILKAAVSKYGKNQWARISSLLVRKSPKQCKARWYEWLDPSIKKTEWSKEEDEKLLHLAKLMPTQWRTIAPIVGRTPAQCLERYQKLLDEAEAREAGAGDDLGLTGSTGHESGPSADDVRKLRPGEIDPEPETKPARPDPVDMDEDEKEMLSEARARLANTQGKKAKRKARERQLEEARRLTALQKRRELKAAGINFRIKKKKNEMDYNADIPFEKKVPLGFYDTTEEANRKVDPGQLTNVHLSKLNRRRADIEEEKREKKRKSEEASGKSEGNQGRFVPAKDAKILKIQEQEQIAKRRKLVLPSPQVGEQELEEIVKAGFTGESAKSLVQEEGTTGATHGLLENYSVTPSTVNTRTPRAPPNADNLMLEARNLRALTTSQTPLLGEENTPLNATEGTGFDGVTPRQSAIRTPNPMATPLRNERPGAVTATPGTAASQTPFRTPLRDHFKINEEESFVGETPREEKMMQAQRKRQLLQGLSSLPKPRNEWEIRLQDLEEQEPEKVKEEKPVEDMADVDRKANELAKQEEQERLARRSMSVQLGLPRPVLIPQLEAGETDEISLMIQEEFARLLKHDSVKYPVAGGKIAPGVTALGELSELENEFDAQTLADARKEMDKEIAKDFGISEEEDVKDAVWKHLSTRPDFEETWRKEREELLFSARFNQFMTLDEIPSDEDKIQGLAKTIESNRQTMIRDATRAGKLEKKLEVRLGGYMARSKALTQQILDAFDEFEAAKIEYESFANLEISEKAAIPNRIAALEEEVDKLARRERELQQKYKELSDEKSFYLSGIISMASRKQTVRRGPTLRGGRTYRPPIGRQSLPPTQAYDGDEFQALNRRDSYDDDDDTVGYGNEREKYDVEMQSIDIREEKNTYAQPTYHHGDETFGDVLSHPISELQAHRKRKEDFEAELQSWNENQHRQLPTSAPKQEDFVIVVHFRQLRGNQSFALDHNAAEEFSRKINLTPQERIQFNGVHDTDGLTAFLYKTKREFSIKIHHKAEIARHDVHSGPHDHSMEHNPDNHIIEFSDNVFVEFKPRHYHISKLPAEVTRRPFFQHPEPDLSADIGEEKAASWLELFYDLFYVATLTEFTHTHVIKDWDSLGLYTSWFVITWWAWTASSLYTARFDTDDVVHHIWKLIEMCAVIGMAGTSEHFLNSQGYIYGYIVFIVALMARSKSRMALAFYIGANLISIALWAGSLPLISHGTHRILWYIGILVEVLVNIIVRGDKTLSWAASHLAERLGLLTLIVLGENLMGLVKLVAEAGTSIYVVLPNFMAVVIIFGFFFMYFEDFNKEVFLHNKYHQIWVYLHFPLHLCQVAFGIALIDTLRVYKQQMVENGKLVEEHHGTATSSHGSASPASGTSEHGAPSAPPNGNTQAGHNTDHSPSDSSASHTPSSSAHKRALEAIEAINHDITGYPSMDTMTRTPITVDTSHLVRKSNDGGYLSLGKYVMSTAAISAMQMMGSIDSGSNHSHTLVRRSAGAAEDSYLSDYEKVFIYKTFLICGGLILVVNSLIKLLNTKISDIYGKVIIGARVLNAVILWSMCALPFAKLDAIVLLSVMMGSLLLQGMVDLLD